MLVKGNPKRIKGLEDFEQEKKITLSIASRFRHKGAL